jgi:hypothetical protein
MHQHTYPDLPPPIVDQPPPVPNDGVAVWDLVIADMQARDQTGRERYGTPLQVENGRSHLIDAYQEMLDGAAYLRAEIERQNLNLPVHSVTTGEGDRADPQLPPRRRLRRRGELQRDTLSLARRGDGG